MPAIENASPASNEVSTSRAASEGRNSPRVAIDASFLDYPPSGIRTYVEHLAIELAATPDGRSSLLVAPGRRLELGEDPADALRAWSGPPRSRRERFLWDASGIARAAREAGADLLHVPHFSAPWRCSLPLVVTIHDLIPLLWPVYRRSRAMRAYLWSAARQVRRASRIVCPSLSAKRETEAVLGLPAERITVIPMAASRRFVPRARDPEMLAMLARFGIDGPYLFNVGGFDVRKNLPVLLEAFARAAPALGSDWKLVIGGAPHSGNTSVFPPLEPLIEQLGLKARVVLTGRLTETEKLLLHQGATIYVTTSLHEGFGLTALEAMACGVPVIAANRTSLPEVVGNGGVLVEPEPDAVAMSIMSIASDSAYAESLRARAIARAAEFSWHRTAEKTAAIYREALAHR